MSSSGGSFGEDEDEDEDLLTPGCLSLTLGEVSSKYGARRSMRLTSVNWQVTRSERETLMDPSPPLAPPFLPALLWSGGGGGGVSYQLIVFNVTLIDTRSTPSSGSGGRRRLWGGVRLPLHRRGYNCSPALSLARLPWRWRGNARKKPRS